MPNPKFKISYDELAKIMALNDKEEQVIIVMTLEQVEAILEFYCEKFGRMVI